MCPNSSKVYCSYLVIDACRLQKCSFVSLGGASVAPAQHSTTRVIASKADRGKPQRYREVQRYRLRLGLTYSLRVGLTSFKVNV